MNEEKPRNLIPPEPVFHEEIAIIVWAHSTLPSPHHSIRVNKPWGVEDKEHDGCEYEDYS